MSAMSLELSSSLLPFRLDVENKSVWRDEQEIFLRPKSVAVLQYLMERPGQIVTKRALHNAIWPSTYVTDGVLRAAIRELRKALHDDARVPQVIETIHGRGYRLIAPLTAPAQPNCQGVQRSKLQVQDEQLATHPHLPILQCVGRAAETDQLTQLLDKAVQGERQVVFVTGEPGIGKTTVVDAFVHQVASRQTVWIAYGQCVAHYGTGEAYLPILDALGQLCRLSEGERFIALLRQYAPSWLRQLPWLVSEAEQEVLQRKVQGTTPERALHEVVAVLEAFTLGTPLLLILEDLQWSDHSTLELLTYIAQRRQPARLCIIGTYRPEGVQRNGHLLPEIVQELTLHKQCVELPLGGLSKAAVTAYMELRFANSERTFPFDELGQLLYQRTEGNPLFMVAMVDDFLQQGFITQTHGQWAIGVEPSVIENVIPHNLRRMIERQYERLSEQEKQVVDVASVAGMSFCVAAISAGVEATLMAVEACCERLARRGQFLQTGQTETWPNDSVSMQYRFKHWLYLQVLYEQLPVERRRYLHRCIGESKEAGYGAQTPDIAAELVIHFSQARDVPRAIAYHYMAAQNARRRHTYHESIEHLRRGLALLGTLPETLERIQQEIRMLLELGVALIFLKGESAPEVEDVYNRAWELWQQLGASLWSFGPLMGRFGVASSRGDLATARALSDQMMAIAQHGQQPAQLMWAECFLGVSLYWSGEVALARVHIEHAICLCGDVRSDPCIDPKVSLLAFAANISWYLGYPDQARQWRYEAQIQAEMAPPYSLSVALSCELFLDCLSRDIFQLQEKAERLIQLSEEYGFGQRRALGVVSRGWARTWQEAGEAGLAEMQDGLATYQATGTGLGLPMLFSLFAEQYLRAGQAEKGLHVLDQALLIMQRNGEWLYASSLLCLKGQLLLIPREGKKKSKAYPEPSQRAKGKTGRSAEAEACLWEAITVARRQQTKMFELRASIQLSRLWQSQGKTREARNMLATIYNWFTEGFETPDLQEAKTLLAALE